MPYVVLDMLGRRFGSWFATDIVCHTGLELGTSREGDLSRVQLARETYLGSS